MLDRLTFSKLNILKSCAAVVLIIAIVQIANLVNIRHQDSITKAGHCLQPVPHIQDYVLGYRNGCTHPITVSFCLAPEKEDLQSCYTNYAEYKERVIPTTIFVEVRKNRRVRIPFRNKIVDLVACKDKILPKRISGNEFSCEPSTL